MAFLRRFYLDLLGALLLVVALSSLTKVFAEAEAETNSDVEMKAILSSGGRYKGFDLDVLETFLAANIKVEKYVEIDQQYVLGIGRFHSEQLVLFMWAYNSAPAISVGDLLRIYHEDLLGQVQDAESYAAFKKSRRETLGSLYAQRDGDRKGFQYFPGTPSTEGSIIELRSPIISESVTGRLSLYFIEIPKSYRLAKRFAKNGH